MPKAKAKPKTKTLLQLAEQFNTALATASDEEVGSAMITLYAVEARIKGLDQYGPTELREIFKL